MTMRWAKVINNEKKTCEVGIGTDGEYFRQLGYRFIEVEEASDGLWYLKGYAPMQPYTPETELEIEKLKKELARFDYIGVKIATGCATIEEYKEEIAYCEELRKKIRKLSGEVIPDEEGAV